MVTMEPVIVNCYQKRCNWQK